jgi:hypothetical protein
MPVISALAPGACLSAVILSVAATTGHAALQPERAAFIAGAGPRLGARMGPVAGLVPQLRVPAFSLGRGLSKRGSSAASGLAERARPGRSRERRLGGAAAAVASAADGAAKVWTEKVESGEHGFEKVIMEVDVGGSTMRLETGEVGRLAAGAIMAKQGESVVYSTACGDLDTNKEEVIEDFVPMSVHYQERSSAAGKTKGGYIKRDGRPSDDEVLVSRIIDRTLRPMFPPGFCREVQILSWVLAYDKNSNVDPLALISSSAALLSSAIPFDIPVAGVAVGMDADGNYVINPSREFLKTSPINLFCSGTEDSVMMIEGAADFVSEEQMMGAIEAGMEAIRKICRGLALFAAKTQEVRGTTSLTQLIRQVSVF